MPAPQADATEGWDHVARLAVSVTGLTTASMRFQGTEILDSRRDANGEMDDAMPEPSEVTHFLAIPWCAAHLTRSSVVVAATRQRRKPDCEEVLLSRTLNPALPWLTA